MQSPANPSGTGRARVALVVGMLKVTRSWYGWAPANSAMEGAGACDLVLWAMGSRGGRNWGRLGSMATLGGGATTSGDGESAKVIGCGITGNGRGDG